MGVGRTGWGGHFPLYPFLNDLGVEGFGFGKEKLGAWCLIRGPKVWLSILVIEAGGPVIWLE